MTDEVLKNRKKYFTKIYDVLTSTTVMDVSLPIAELDNKRPFIDIVGKPDYDSILLSREIEGLYVADDLFLRRIFRIIHQNNFHTNTVSFLFQHFQKDISEFLKLHRILSRWDYLHLYNAEMMIDIIKALNNQFKIVGQGTVYDTFEMVIHNSLRTRIGFDVYERELLSAVFTLYDFRLFQNFEYCFKIILKKIVMFYSFYGKDVLTLKAKIKFLLGEYPLRKEYYLDLLEDVLKLY